MGKITKNMKKDGKITFDGPKVKDRIPFAPATQRHKAEKGKGGYVRKKKVDEDEQSIEQSRKYKKGETSEIKKAHLDALRERNKGKKLPPPEKTELRKLKPSDFEGLGESTSIIKFIEAIMTEDHANAHEYLKSTINQKIQQRISQEIEKPLF